MVINLIFKFKLNRSKLSHDEYHCMKYNMKKLAGFREEWTQRCMKNSWLSHIRESVSEKGLSVNEVGDTWKTYYGGLSKMPRTW